MEKSNCLRCGKPLTDPESVRRGYGPECFRITIDWKQNRLGFSENLDEKENAATAMEKRYKLVQAVKCPTCGYKDLKPISWTESTCLICKLNHNKYTFKI